MTMQTKTTSGFRSVFLDRLQTTMRGYVLRGMLVLVPLGVTAYVLKLCYGLTAGLLLPGLRQFIGEMPGYAIVLLSILLFVSILYMIGLIAGQVLGRRLIAVGEWFLARIPVVKTIYGASRQAVDVLSIQPEDGESHKSVAVVPFPSPGIQALAFITGKLSIDGEDKYCRSFVPTTPNPTSGYFEIFPRDMLVHTDLTMEDAAKAFMSAGVLTPSEMHLPQENKAVRSPSVETAGTAAKTSRKLPKSLLRRSLLIIRNRLVSGLLVLVPIGVTIFIVTFIYDLTAGRIEPIVTYLHNFAADRFESLAISKGPLPPYVTGFIAIVLLLVSLYATGQIATAVVGARVIRFMEAIIGRMPVITTIYGATKQIIESLIDPSSGPKFEAPVLVEFPYPGVYSIGFVVGRIRNIEGRELIKVFVPTTPNITVGLLQFYYPENVSGCDLTLEEAIKMVVSGGLVGNDNINRRPVSEVLKRANDGETKTDTAEA